MINKEELINEIDKRIKVLQKSPKENHKTICHLDSLKQFILKTEEEKPTFTKEEYDLARAAAYEAGKQVMKQQMLKNAVECDVEDDGDGLFTTETCNEMTTLLNKIGAKVGDKVKLAIVKEN